MCIAIHIDVHIKITNLFKNNKLKILETFMSNINLLKELDILGVKNYGTSEQPLFKAKDIGEILDIKDINSSIRNFNKNQLCKMKIHYNTLSMLTCSGFYSVLSMSRKPLAIDLANKLNINLIHKYIPSETSFVFVIKKIFKCEEIIEQFPIDYYKVDLYFPKYKLVIEFDEKHHINLNNIIEDNIREKIITDKLG